MVFICLGLYKHCFLYKPNATIHLPYTSQVVQLVIIFTTWIAYVLPWKYGAVSKLQPHIFMWIYCPWHSCGIPMEYSVELVNIAKFNSSHNHFQQEADFPWSLLYLYIFTKNCSFLSNTLFHMICSFKFYMIHISSISWKGNKSLVYIFPLDRNLDRPQTNPSMCEWMLCLRWRCCFASSQIIYKIICPLKLLHPVNSLSPQVTDLWSISGAKMGSNTMKWLHIYIYTRRFAMPGL